ncbi:MAG: RNA polymerase sigma factor [Phaeodactylibacter sp.]|nr:RNA polymerase sigma factor [Phaeodactylibacter sp.]
MRYCPESTDLELINGCKEGDRLAQKYLYERYFGRVLGISMRYTGNKEEAVEVLNLAFLKVFENIGQFKSKGSLGGWIAKIVFNTSIDFVRSQVTYRKVMDFNTEQEVPIQNDALDNLAVEDIFQFIQQLPAANRTVFCMYVIDGYKHQEIAEQLEISEGTSKWYLSEARKQLRHLMQHYLRSPQYI